MSVLRRDLSVPYSRADVIWCCPVGRQDFAKLVKTAHTFKGVTPQGMRYLHRIGQRRERIVIVLAPQEGADYFYETKLPVLSAQDIETECAWLRLCKDVRCPIYVVPSSKLPELRGHEPDMTLFVSVPLFDEI